MSAITNLRLTAKLIPIIAPFIAKNDIRYYLSGINVRPHKDGGAIICATNGHALGLIYDREAVCDEEVTLRIDARMIQSCGACIGKNRTIKTVNGRLVLIDEEGEAEVYIQAGDPVINPSVTYPRYERVVPSSSKVRPGLIGTYAANLMELLNRSAAASLRANGGKVYTLNALQFFNVEGSDNGPAVVRHGANADFIGVLMSMRADQPKELIPSWVPQFPTGEDSTIMAGSKS